jgi:serine protease Do
LVLVLLSCAASSVSAAPDTGTPPPVVSGSVTGQAKSVPSLPLPSVPDLVDAVKASVVNVDVRMKISDNDPRQRANSELMERFFGRPRNGGPPHEHFQQGKGSGVIVEADGVMLTNNHVVQNATQIRVKLNDGRSFDGDVLGSDPLTDLAVVKLKGVKPGSLPFAKLGDSEALRVGEWVVAIGNPFGLASSVSLGIISAKERQIGAGPYEDFLQTDAAINPGNSGGPLFNLKGEVIGINTAITGEGSGIGFAIPSNQVKSLIPQLEKSGKVTRGWLGVAVQDLSPELAQGLKTSVIQGALVAEVTEKTPAAQAGLKADDVVTAVDGTPVTSAGVLTRTIAMRSPGSTVTLHLIRNGRAQELKVKLGTRPDLEGLQTKPKEAAESERQEKLGLAAQDMDPAFAQNQGLPNAAALITEVTPDSPAERAGLIPGAAVTEAGGKPVRSAADLRRALSGAAPGSVVLLRVQTPGGKGLRALTIPK